MKWAVLDIETTGVDGAQDEIIDLGFLKFDGAKFEGRFSSLISCQKELSPFLQKLTGIHPQDLESAPEFEEVKPALLALKGYQILAHYSAFEQSFLAPIFAENFLEEDRPVFIDSIPLMHFLWPFKSEFNLESFIRDFDFRAKEVHRGYEDAYDLLRCLLMVMKTAATCGLWWTQVQFFMEKYGLHRHFYGYLMGQGESFWQLIAKQIEFDLDGEFAKYQKRKGKEFFAELAETESESEADFDEMNEYEESINGPFSSALLKANYAALQRQNAKWPQFSYRPSQEELSIKIGQSFKNKIHGLVQAPTGVGKTFGYLLPAMFFSMLEKEKVVISTATKHLQGQVLFKDLPRLRSMVKATDSLKIVRLVGSKNHYCEFAFRQKMQENPPSLFQSAGQEREEENFFQLSMELYFAFQTLKYELRGKLKMRDPAAAPFFWWFASHQTNKENTPYFIKKMKAYREWEKDLTVDYQTCLGSTCPFAQACSYVQDMKSAKDADILIVNHALLLSWPQGQERPQYVIIDEAHKFADMASQQLSQKITHTELEQMTAQLEQSRPLGVLTYLLQKEVIVLGPIGPEAAERTAALRQSFMQSARTLIVYFMIWKEKIAQLFAGKVSPFWQERVIAKGLRADTELLEILGQVNASLTELVTLWRPSVEAVMSLKAAGTNKDLQDLYAINKHLAFFESLVQMKTVLEIFLDYGRGDLPLVKFHQDEGWNLEIGIRNIGAKVFEEVLKPAESIIHVSATLGPMVPSEDEKFMDVLWESGHLYLPPKKRFRSIFCLPPLYEYEHKAKVFLCDDTPPMNDPQYIGRVIGELAPLIEKLEGRALLLFSSRERFEKARDQLISIFEGRIPLFIQGMGHQIVEDFKLAPMGILLGMESLGEGIDIPGKSLQLVFIDKIPDLKFDAITQERRKFFDQEFGDEFHQFYLLTRGRLLLQKMGRLLRNEADYGVIIICDNRIKTWKEATTRYFGSLLSPYQIVRSRLHDACTEAYEFIKEHEHRE